MQGAVPSFPSPHVQESKRTNRVSPPCARGRLGGGLNSLQSSMHRPLASSRLCRFVSNPRFLAQKGTLESEKEKVGFGDNQRKR